MLRVSEVYSSIQGEGPNVGRTTVFVRFAGCNLRCPGWPCDTQHAIDPKYRSEWAKTSSEDLVTQIEQCIDISGAECITLTGGEPFLQKHDDLYKLINQFPEQEIDCFSNGLLTYPEWAPNYINFIMDWKLLGSGESIESAIRLHNLHLLAKSDLDHAVKFVIKDWTDFEQAVQIYHKHFSSYNNVIEIYYGRVWDSKLTDRDLAEAVMLNGLPWRLNVQMHNYIWPANERGK